MVDYHDRPEWSYSQMKMILDHGIDYALAAKRKMLPGPTGAAIDLGQLAHMIVLGGKDCYVFQEDSGFENFRTNAAKAWRDEKIALGKTIITRAQWEDIKNIVNNIDNHPYTLSYLKGNGFKYETEMYANVEGVSMRGKADALFVKEWFDVSSNCDVKSLLITDLKTTTKFDEFFRRAQYQHYDLQAAVYTLIGSASQEVSSSFTNYYFCVAETFAPYRVQFMHASPEFLESGERKLRRCIDTIKEAGDREPNFLLEDVPELGDFSL